MLNDRRMRKMAGKKPTRSVEGSEKVWGLKEIEQLIDALIERQVTEFEMEQNGAKIRVKRGTAVASSRVPERFISRNLRRLHLRRCPRRLPLR